MNGCVDVFRSCSSVQFVRCEQVSQPCRARKSVACVSLTTYCVCLRLPVRLFDDCFVAYTSPEVAFAPAMQISSLRRSITEEFFDLCSCMFQLSECPPDSFPFFRIVDDRIHRVTVAQFCSISMPVDFCRHFIGKNSDKCLSL